MPACARKNLLCTLPNDLILMLADFLSHAEINAVSHTCSRLHAVLDHALYARNARQGQSTALIWAARRQEIGTAKKALSAKANTEAVLEPTMNGLPADARELVSKTPLAFAAASGNSEMASLLIESGAVVDYPPEAIDFQPVTRRPLLAAVVNGHLGMTKLLLEAGTLNLNTFFANDGNSVFGCAARYGHVHIMKHLLPVVGELDSSIIGIGDTPLRLATRGGHRDAVKLLLDSGRVNPNLRDSGGRTALFYAIDGGFEDVLQCLVDAPEVNPNLFERSGRAAIVAALQMRAAGCVKVLMASDRIEIPTWAVFRLACQTSFMDIVQWLWNLGKLNSPEKDDRGNSWLHIAAETGCTDAVKLLLRKTNVAMDGQRDNGQTALICAVENKHRATSTALLKAGADITIVCNNGKTVLHYAARHTNLALVQTLLSQGADVNHVSHAGETPLHAACHNGDPRIVKLMLDHGASPTVATPLGKTPIHIACDLRWDQVVQLLLSKTPRSDPVLCESQTPLLDACQSGHTAIVKNLLAHGANPLARLPDGTTPLLLASKGHPFIVAMLLENCADPMQTDGDGNTALHVACRHNTPRVTSTLLKKGADPNVRAPNEVTPLHQACRYGSLMLVRALLKAGATIGAAKSNGSTPLHEVCDRSNPSELYEIVKLLVDSGADVQATTQAGQSALHLACASNRPQVAALLISKGALLLARNDLATDPNHSTPFHSACTCFHESRLETLLHTIPKPLPETFQSGWTPLHAAATSCQRGNINVLVDNGCDPMALTEDGRTMLQELMRTPRIPETRRSFLMKTIIDVGVDVNHRDQYGNTALAEAMSLHPSVRAKLVLWGGIM